jgi:hypothetical protein
MNKTEFYPEIGIIFRSLNVDCSYFSFSSAIWRIGVKKAEKSSGILIYQSRLI